MHYSMHYTGHSRHLLALSPELFNRSLKGEQGQKQKWLVLKGGKESTITPLDTYMVHP
jgi:hypothetical protein